MKSMDRYLRFLLPLIGVACIVAPGHVAGVLPYLLGGGMLFTGLLHGISYLRAQAFLESRAPELGQDVILTVMGAAFLCEGSGAVGIMGITWGLLGLRKAAETINEALRRAYRRESALLTGAEAFLRVILALALLFEPLEKFAPPHHAAGPGVGAGECAASQREARDGRAQVRRRHIAQYH